MCHTLCVPLSARVCLSVDNLTDIANLEKHIEDSELILIFATRDYISSANCRREILEASRLTKPMLILVETDPSKGAPTVGSLRQELNLLVQRRRVNESQAACISTNLIDRVESGDTLQWHREKQFKYAVLKSIAQSLLLATGPARSPSLRLHKRQSSGLGIGLSRITKGVQKGLKEGLNMGANIGANMGANLVPNLKVQRADSGRRCDEALHYVSAELTMWYQTHCCTHCSYTVLATVGAEDDARLHSSLPP